MEPLWDWLPAAVMAVVVFAVLLGANYVLFRRQGGLRTQRLLGQLAMLALSGAGVVAVVLTLPISPPEKVSLLQILGVLVSAAIALSSTTFVGNAMAGMMLRALRNFRAGDFVEVGGHLGRVSERGLFHVEIQTEDRDLTTLPNLYLITQPVKVVRSSGTIVSATVSLGYDVSHARAEELLIEAARASGLEEAFVQVVDLGDHAVSYRAAGFLEEVKHLLEARSRLRACMLDALHHGGVEIVSPTFMNQRALPADRVVQPAEATPRRVAEHPMPQDVIFDKAEAAETRVELEHERVELEKELEELKAKRSEFAEGDERRAPLERGIETVRSRLLRIEERLAPNDADDD
jgi:small-conductance mechanosensitive channel